MVPVKAVLTVNNDAYVTVPPTPITIPYSSSDPMCTEGVCERGQLKYAVTPKDVETSPDKSEFDTSVPTGETDSGFRDAGEYRI